MSESNTFEWLVHALEFGFRAHEKGWNWEMTLTEFRKLLKGWNTI